MSDPLSGTFRGPPAPLRPSWRLPALSRRWRDVLVAAAPVTLFGACSLLLGDFLLALFVSGLLTCVGLLLWLALVLLRAVDEGRDETAELGRQVTSHVTFRREVQANTDDTARLEKRVRFLEEMTLGEPQSRDGRRTG